MKKNKAARSVDFALHDGAGLTAEHASANSAIGKARRVTGGALIEGIRLGGRGAACAHAPDLRCGGL